MLCRVEGGPVLTRENTPDIGPVFTDVSAVFNPGATFFNGQTELVLRVQSRGRHTGLLRATSADGRNFEVANNMLKISGLESISNSLGLDVYHIYDPRLTVVDGQLLCCVAIDTNKGCRLGTGILTDNGLELAGIDDHDSRNGVLFPEKINDLYVRLERPNNTRLEAGPVTGQEIVLATSNDLKNWQIEGPVFCGRPHYWDELIGAGPAPIKTRDGWLLIYHGVATHFAGVNIYQAGAALLDLEDPSKVSARGSLNILEPRETYETVGQVPNVVFPSGCVVREFDPDGYAAATATVQVYYGAADTCIGLAEATIENLVAACYV